MRAPAFRFFDGDGLGIDPVFATTWDLAIQSQVAFKVLPSKAFVDFTGTFRKCLARPVVGYPSGFGESMG